MQPHPGPQQSHLPYGGLSHVLLGDAEQHDPVKGKPLHFRAHAEQHLSMRTLMEISRKDAQAAQGRDLFLQHREVYLLTTQHRQDTSASGRSLQWWCDKLRDPNLTLEEVQQFLEFLNARAITNIDEYISLVPHIATLRNLVRPDLNYRLAVMQVCASTQHQLIYCHPLASAPASTQQVTGCI
jgi:hypothetical protein